MLIVLIHNEGDGENGSSNYEFEVRVNDALIEAGKIKNFNRKKGWKNLILRMLEETENAENI